MTSKRNKTSKEIVPDNSYDAHVPFDPVQVGLEATFRLTHYADLRNLCERTPQQLSDNQFHAALAEVPPGSDAKETLTSIAHLPMVSGIERQLLVASMRKGAFTSLQSSDLLDVMVDDPYLMGHIACSNVLGHLYGAGVTECDNLLMLLCVGTGLTESQRNAVMPTIMQGFRDGASNAGTVVTGGHASYNPWCVIGGVATRVIAAGQFELPNKATHGQILVLTKPLGATLALWAHRWFDHPTRGARIRSVLDHGAMRAAYTRATYAMARSNRPAAILMRRYQATAYINVSGSGLFGQAKALAAAQENDVDFIIYNMPIIPKMFALSSALNYNIQRGVVPEYSGGLLIAFEREHAALFCKEMLECTGLQVWAVGIVEAGNKKARVIRKPRVIEANYALSPLKM